MADFSDISIVEYLDATGIPYKQANGDCIYLVDYDSMRITPSKDLFHRFSTNSGGKGVYSFVKEFAAPVVHGIHNPTDKEVVNHLVDIFGPDRCHYTDYNPKYNKSRIPKGAPQKSTFVPGDVEKRPFELPPYHQSYANIHKYLCEERGLSDTVLMSLMSKGLLYESNEPKQTKDGRTWYAHNAVFVRHDLSDGLIKAGTIKGSYVDPKTGRRFTKDVPGSEKAKTLFFFRGNKVEVPDHVVIFEAEIDLASYLTLQEVRGVDIERFLCVSLGGVNAHLKIGENLQSLFDRFPTIKTACLAFDNDYDKDVNVGQSATASLSYELSQIGMKVKSLDVHDGIDGKKCKDWNDCLKEYRKGNWELPGIKNNGGGGGEGL